MDCPECGAINPENAEFCNLCFHRFNPPEGPAAPVPESPTTPDAPVRTPLDLASVDVPMKPGAVVDAEIPPEKAAPEVSAVPQEGPAKPGGDPDSPRGQDIFLQPIPGSLPPGANPERKSHALMMFLIGAGLIGIVMLIIFFSMSSGGGTKLFKSERGTLSFRYPSAWKTINASEIKSLTGFDVGVISSVSEITLVGRGKSGDIEYIFSAVSVPNNLAGDWNAVKTRAKTTFLDELAARDPGTIGSGGTTFLSPKYADIKVGQDPAYSMKADLKTPSGDTATVEQVVFYHEDSGYLLTLVTLNGAPNVSRTILDSVTFTITPPPTTPKQ